jgi:hypothetical protein
MLRTGTNQKSVSVPGIGNPSRCTTATGPNVYINEAPWDADASFGGYKQSSNGREHAEFGLGDYLELKAAAGY